MSTQKRKITYWSIDFVDNNDEHSFDQTLLCRFMAYVKGLDEATRLEKNESTNKAISLQSVEDEIIQGIHLLKIVFKSCKFNHSPDYMSSTNGTERPSDKKLDEGEKELTHICMKIDTNEAYTAFEERRSGVTMRAMIQYLNQLLKKYFKEIGQDDNRVLGASIVPSDDFLTSLDTTEKISSVELFVEKEVLGSKYLDLMSVKATSQEDIVITIKSKPRESIVHQAVREAYLRLTTEGYKASRIRIRGKDINKMNVIIDSLNGKRVEEVTVNLLENGVVDTHSIFSKLEGIFGVTE